MMERILIKGRENCSLEYENGDKLYIKIDMKETIKKIAENLQWYKDHPKAEVKKLSLQNCIEMTEEFPEDAAHRNSLLAELRIMRTGGYNHIKWLRCRELIDRIRRIYS